MSTAAAMAGGAGEAAMPPATASSSPYLTSRYFTSDPRADILAGITGAELRYRTGRAVRVVLRSLDPTLVPRSCHPAADVGPCGWHVA